MGWRILTANRKYIGDDEGKILVARLLGNEEQRRLLAPLVVAAPQMLAALEHLASVLAIEAVTVRGSNARDLKNSFREIIETTIAKAKGA